MEIAPDFTDTNSRALDLTKEDEWRRAIEALRLRVAEPLLKPVRASLSFYRSGFAILALDSPLVETLRQFIRGVEEAAPGDAAGGVSES